MLSFNKPQLRVWFFSAEVSRPYKTQSRLNPAKTSNCPRSSVISTLAQPILALAWELPSTLTSPDGPRTASQLLRTDVKYWAYNPVEPVVNLVDKLVSNLILINVKCAILFVFGILNCKNKFISFSILGHTYDISNKHRLGHSEVSLVQTMIDGVNTLWQEDLVFQKKHGM